MPAELTRIAMENEEIPVMMSMSFSETSFSPFAADSAAALSRTARTFFIAFCPIVNLTTSEPMGLEASATSARADLASSGLSLAATHLPSGVKAKYVLLNKLQEASLTKTRPFVTTLPGCLARNCSLPSIG